MNKKNLTPDQRDRVEAALRCLGLIKRGRPSKERIYAEQELGRAVQRLDRQQAKRAEQE